MTPLHITMDAEVNPLGIDVDKLVGQGMLTHIGLLRHGTDGGQASLAMIITLQDGTQVLAETTWKLFKTAYMALAASPVVAEEVWD